MLKLKLQYFSHQKQRADSFGKTLMLGKIEGERRRGRQRMRRLDGITDSMDMGLGATPLFSPVCWEPGFQAWAQSTCPELSAQGLVPLRWGCALPSPNAPGRAPNHDSSWSLVSPSNEHSGLISFRMDWLDLLAVQGTLKSLSNTTVQKHQFFGGLTPRGSLEGCHLWGLTELDTTEVT